MTPNSQISARISKGLELISDRVINKDDKRGLAKSESNSKHNDLYSSSSIIFDTTSPDRASCIKYNGGQTV